MLIHALHCVRCLRKTDRGLAVIAMARLVCASVILLLFVAPSFVFGQGILTNVTVTPSSPTAGAGTVYTINLTASPAGSIPGNGKIRLSFPAGFDIANTTLAQNFSGLNSGYSSVDPTGQILTLTRDGAGTALPASAAASFGIAVVYNATVAGGYKIFVETLTSADAVIDTATSVAFAISPGPVQHFALSPVTTVTAGTPFSLTITAKDVYNNTVTSFAGTLSLSDNTNTLTPPTAIIASGGTVTVSNAMITKAQNGVLVTVVGGNVTGASNSFTVVHRALDHFAVTRTSGGIIGSQGAGTPFNIRLVALDAFDNTVTAFTGSVTLSNTTNSITPTSSGNFSSGVLASLPVTISKTASADQITVSGGAPAITGSSNTFFVGAAGLSGFQIDPVSSPQTAGVPIPLKITALDANSNTVTGFTGTVNFSLNSGAITPTVSGNFVAGVWNGNVTVLTSGNGKIITVTDGVRSISSNAFDVNAGGLDNFVIAPIGSQPAGKNFTVTVTARDANNNDVSHTGTVTLSDNTGSLTASSLVFSGQATQSVNDVKIKKAKSNVVISASGSGKGGSSNAFAVTVEAGTLDHFAVTNTSGGNINSPQTAGAAFNIKIVAQDQFDNTITSFNETVTITDLGTLNLTSANFVSGVLASQSVTINQARYDDQLTVAGGTPASTGASNLFNVIPGGLDHFTVDAIAEQAAGVPFAIVVRARDLHDNLATSFAGTVTFSDLTGTITPTSSGSFNSGVWSGSVTITQTRASDVITVNGGGKTGSSNSFNVTASGVDHFVINNIGNQTAGQPFSVIITAQDASNNTVSSFNGTVTVSDLSGSIAPATSNAFTNGTVTQNFTITKSFTGDKITVTGVGKSSTSNTFNVVPGNLHHFAIATIANQTAGVSFPITITAQDVNNNTVTSFGGTVTISINAGSITPTTSGAFANGVRSESVTIPNVANNLIISVNDGSGHSGTSNAFNVTAGGLARFVFDTIATQAADAPFSFTIRAKDGNDNDVSFNGTITLSDNTTTLTPTSVTMNGTSVTVSNAQITKAQTVVLITAAGGGKSGTSNPFTVSPGALSRVRIVQGNSGPGTKFTSYSMTTDDQLQLHVAGYDAFGNYTNIDPPVNWVMTNALGVINPATASSFTTFSANKVGTFKIIADHATAIDDTTGNITITFGVANNVKVLQGAFGAGNIVGDVTLNTGDNYTVHASSFDADGNRIGDVSVTWKITGGNIGVVNPTTGTSTTFTATTVGTGTIIADHATLIDGVTGTITVSASTLSFIRILEGSSGGANPPIGNVTISTDKTLQVHAAGYDANGNFLGNQNVTWSLSNPAIGTLSPSSGTATIFDPKTPGAGVITATHATAGSASTGTITVIAGPPHHIKVLKGLSGPTQEVTTDTLATGETRVVHASSFDIDDNYLADVSVTWNVSGGIGSLNPLSGASTTLTATTVGFGVITAQHATLGNDQTGVITVKIGGLSSVRIVEGPSGPGSKLGATSRNTDQAVTVHAAGYDANNNYLGDQSVTWSVIGNNIGTLDNQSGPSTTLTLQHPGIGRIVADHASARDDTTGNITVATGALHHVKVLAGTQNEAAVVTDHSMSTDQTFIVHAGGYDADDNYKNDVSVNWTVTGGIGILAPATGISTTLNARKVGNGQIKADHPTSGVIDGLTGTITVTPGALAFIKVIEGPNGPDTPNKELGAKNLSTDEVLQLHAAGFDADSNYVGDQPANWSSAGNLTPVVVGTNVTSISFAPTLSPASGTIRATHSTAGFDETGTITVNDGALAKIKILSGGSGETADVGATTVPSGNTLQVHAAGFDADDNYISDLIANWSVLGQIGSLSASSGISTILTAGSTGTGTIRATSGALVANTGPVTVIQGNIAKIILRTASGNGGLPFDNYQMTADQEVALYAAGYDAGNNYRGDVNVTWSNTDNLTPAVSASGSSFTFAPTLANTDGSVKGQIIGTYSPSIKDSTGTITVLPGNPSGNISLTAAPSGLPSDGSSTSTITSGVIKDADGNDVGAGKLFTVTLNPLTLGAIVTPDADANTPGQQVATNALSRLSFVFRAGTTGGIVSVNVNSGLGATGSTQISLGSISIVSVTTTPTTVSRGQQGISVSMTVQNLSSAPLTEVAVGLTFTGSADRTGEYSVTVSPGNPTSLAGNSTATFSFIVNVGANATLETVTLNGTVSGKVNGTPVSTSSANQTDSWTVQRPAELKVTSVTAAPDTVAQGQTGVVVRVRVANNLGQPNSANAAVDSVRLIFKQGALIKTSEYIIANPTNPTSIAGNSEAEFAFLVNVGSAATLGLIAIDASVYYKEGNSNLPLTDLNADTPDAWTVIEGNVFSIVSLTPSQSTVTANMTKPWQVRMQVRNGGSSPIQLNLAPDRTFIRFIIGNQNVTSQYGLAQPSALDEGGTVLAANSSGHLTFGITPTGSTTGTATISGFAEGRDQAGQTVTDNTNDFGAGAVTVQSLGTLKIDRIDVSQSPVTANRTKDWVMTATVTNEGESAVQLHPFADSMKITVGNNVGYIYGKPATFKDGTSVLGTRETKLLEIVVDQTGSQTGTLPINVSLRGIETNSSRLVASTGVTGSITVQSQAALEITAVTPSRLSVTTNQTAGWTVNVAVRNNGGSQVVVKSDSSTNLRFRIGTQFQSGYGVTLQSAPTIGAGQTANLVFVVNTTGPNPGTAALWVKVAATETNGDAEVIDTDNSSSVLVQSPPNVVYIGNSMLPDIVNIGSSNAFTVRVSNATGASTVALNPATTRFRFSGGPANFVAALDANFVQNIVPNDTTLTFVSTAIPANMPIGTYTPVVELRGTENGNPYSKDLTVTPNELRVTAPAQVQIVSVQPSQSTVTASMTKPWNVVVRVANNGGFQVKLDSVNLQLVNGIDRKSEYDITYPAQFIAKGSAILEAGATDSLRFVFNRTGTTTGPTALQVRLFVTDQSNGQQINPPPVGNTSFIVQSPAEVRITGVATSQATVTANRGSDWTITATVTNEGESAIRLHPAVDSIKITVGNNLGYVYVKPASFTDGSNLLGGRETKTLAITVDQTGPQTGVLPIRADLKGIETNSNRLVASTGVSGSIDVQSQADLQILLVTPSRASVTAGQTTPWTVAIAVRNNGGSQVTVKSDTASTNLRFRIGAQFQNGYDVGLQSAPAIGGLTTANLVFVVNKTGPNAGTTDLLAKVAAVETNSGVTIATPPHGPSSVLVQTAPNISYINNNLQPKVVNNGSAYAFTVRVRNTGGATVALDPANTKFLFSGGPANFTALLDANRVTLLAPGDTTLTFVAATIPVNMPEGTYTPAIELRGTQNANPFSKNLTTTPNELSVTAPAQVQIVSVRPSQSTVTAGMRKPWNLTVIVTNNGGFQARLDSVSLRLFNGNDVTRDFDIPPVTKFFGSNNVFLNAGVTDSLRFLINRTGNKSGNTTAQVRLFLTDQSNGQPITPAPEGNTNFLVQSPAALKITSIAPSQPTVTRNQTQQWRVDMSVANLGGSEVQIDFNSNVTKINFGFSAGYTVQPPATLLSGGKRLRGDSSGVLRFLITQTGSQTGLNTINGQILATELNSNDLRSDDTNDTGSGAVLVQTEAQLRIDTVRVVGAPNAPFVNTLQPFSVRAVVNNLGGENADSVKVRLNTTGTSQITPATLDIAGGVPGGQAKAVRFNITASSSENAAGEVFRALVAAAKGHNTGVNVVSAPARDDTAVVKIQRPASLQVVEVKASEDTVAAGQDTDWFIYVIVKNNGGATLTLETPRVDNLQIKIDDSTQTDYGKAVEPFLLHNRSLSLAANEQDTLRFTITSTGLSGGQAALIADLAGRDRNDNKPVSAPGTGQIYVRTTATVRLVQTEPVVRRPLINGVGFVNVNQVFSLKLTVENTGFEGVKEVVVRLQTNGRSRILTPEQTIPAIEARARQELSFSVQADTGAVAGTPPEIFNGRVVSGLTAKGNQPANIQQPLDSTAQVVVQRPARLSVTALIQDDNPVLSNNQSFTFSARVTNSGQAAVDKSGLVKLIYPSGFSIAGSAERSFVVDSLVTWQVNAPPQAVDAADLVLQITKAAADLNSQSLAELGKSADTLTVKVVQSDIRIVRFYISSPEGAKDSTLSTEQKFKLTAELVVSPDLRNGTVALRYPDGYIVPDVDTLKTLALRVTNQTVTWDNVQAPVVANAIRVYFQTRASGTNGNGEPVSSSARAGVVTVDKASPNLSIAIINPPGAEDGIVSLNQSFTISARVDNDGAAGNKDTMKVRLELGTKGFTTAEVLEKPIQMGGSVTWEVKAPNSIVQDSLAVRISRLPLDENSDQAADVPLNRKLKRLSVRTDSVKSEIRIVSFAIVAPRGAARNNTLSTRQQFIVRAQVEGKRVIDAKVELTLPLGFTTNDNTQQTFSALESRQDVNWAISAPSQPTFAGQLDSIHVKAGGNDANDRTKPLPPDRKFIAFRVEDQARLAVFGEISSPVSARSDGIVSRSSVFNVTAKVLNRGQAAAIGKAQIELVLPRDSRILPAEDYRLEPPTAPLRQDLADVAKDSVTWQIKARSQASTGIDKITLRLLRPDPIDANTDSSAAVEDREFTISVQTEPKILIVQMLPNPSAGPVALGEKSAVLLRLKLTNQGNLSSSNVLLRGFTLHVRDRDDKPLNASSVIKALRVVDTHRPAQVLGSQTTIPAADSLKVLFAPVDALAGGVPDSMDVVVDIVDNNAAGSAFRMTFTKAADVDAIDEAAPDDPVEIIFLDERGNTVAATEVTSRKHVIGETDFAKSFYNYPNPFSPYKNNEDGTPGTKFKYYLSQTSNLEFRIYTVLGELVYEKSYKATDPQGQASSDYNYFYWDGKNGNGDMVLNGVYIALLKTSAGTATTKVAVVK